MILDSISIDVKTSYSIVGFAVFDGDIAGWLPHRLLRPRFIVVRQLPIGVEISVPDWATAGFCRGRHAGKVKGFFLIRGGIRFVYEFGLVEQISTVFMEVVADLCASKKLLLPMICCT